MGGVGGQFPRNLNWSTLERDSLELLETRPRNLTFLCFFLDNLNLFTKETRFSVPWFDYNLRDCVLSAMYREFGFRNTGSFCLWNLKSGEIWVVESWILGFGIQNTAHGIQNPTDDWNPESRIQNPSSTDKKSGIQYMESGIQVLGLYASKVSPRAIIMALGLTYDFLLGSVAIFNTT